MSRYDYLEEVQKFNPYHGRDGRFSTADNATQFTWKPGQGVMYDNAIAREKKRTASMIPSRSVKGDPDTIAGVKCGTPMTREQANEGRPNPNFEKGGGYRVNCQSCVVAYEARLRGYDVQAKSNTKSNPDTQALSRDVQLAWIDPATGKKAIALQNDNVNTAKQCKQWMEDTIQEGERYVFRNGWKGRSRTGHIISADRDADGSLRMYDPQSGVTYKGADIDDYLSLCKFKSTRMNGQVRINEVRLMRVDDKIINPNMANGIMEAVNHG